MMKSIRGHIRGIVDELMNNAIKAKADKIDIDIRKDDKEVSISVVDNGQGMDEDKLRAVMKKLQQPRRYELEEYYGALAGESLVGTGLSIVGMMTDRAEVETELGKGTKIKVYLQLKN